MTARSRRMRRTVAGVVGGVALAAVSMSAADDIEPAGDPAPVLRIGSKSFTESYVLAEIAARKLASSGHEAVHRPGMGGTIILWQALLQGEIDAYPDYTGTIAEEILKTGGRPALEELREGLAEHGIGLAEPLGFNNSYALVMRREQAERLGLDRVADLAGQPSLRVGLTHEFLERRDGWRPLSAHYDLEMEHVAGLEHSLAYAALARGDLDVIDAYTTDAKLAELDLTVLADDRGFFPRYDAVFLYRTDLGQRARATLAGLSGTIDDRAMIRLNAEAERTASYTAAAALYLGRAIETDPVWRRIAGWTLRHLQLVGLSLLLAIAGGVPLGILASRPGPLGQMILAGAGVIYTIPSLALLAVLVAVPFLGIATRTAIVALFLYSLLPIVRNTASGLRNIPPAVRESAAALGLEPGAQLRKVLLPIALPTILAGVKTAAVINVATATLAALIGVGGLGEPILSGLNLNDPGTILQGALPAAVLGILVQGLFDVLERLVTPRGMRS